MGKRKENEIDLREKESTVSLFFLSIQRRDLKSTWNQISARDCSLSWAPAGAFGLYKQNAVGRNSNEKKKGEKNQVGLLHTVPERTRRRGNDNWYSVCASVCVCVKSFDKSKEAKRKKDKKKERTFYPLLICRRSYVRDTLIIRLEREKKKSHYWNSRENESASTSVLIIYALNV